MSEVIEEILAKCLEQMETGASLESCLTEFPNQAAELEPLLRITQQMKPLTNVGPRPTFARDARLELENQLAISGKAVTLNGRNRHTKQEPKLLFQSRFSMSMLQLIVAAVLALMATTGGAAYAANASSPGDFLHDLDLAMENARLNLSPDVWSKVQLRLEFASERLTEAQETFAKNNAPGGLEAVNEYGTEISAIAQLIGNADGADQEALGLLVETAQGVHVDVLMVLLDTVPEQARESIQIAIAASHTPDEIPGSVPSDSGAPEGAGAPADAGATEAVGAPDEVGAPNESGVPDDTFGTDISACANSLSKETAQALVDLAKEHDVDRQSVVENFCVVGTLEQVSEMLSELQGPPTDVPAGPPTDVPGGPPSDTPGGQPTDVPGGPPSDPPGGPPIDPPGRP